jgi:WD40 repeat protein
VRVWDLRGQTEEAECVLIFREHDGPVTSVSFCSERNFVVTGSTDKTVKLLDLDTGYCIRTMAGHQAGVNSAAISAKGGRVVSGAQDWSVKVWDLDNGGSVQALSVEELQPICVAVSPDSRRVASVNDDSTRPVTVWDVRSANSDFLVLPMETGDQTPGRRTPSTTARGAGGATAQESGVLDMRFVAFSRCCTYLVAASDNKGIRMRVWKSPEFQLMALVGTVGQTACSLAVSGRYIIIGTKTGLACLWDLKAVAAGRTDQVAKTLGPVHRAVSSVKGLLGPASSPISAVAISDDERFLAGTCEFSIQIWLVDTSTDGPLLEGHESYVISVAISADSQLVVSGSVDNHCRLWERETGRCLRVLVGDRVAVRAVAFQGQTVISAAGDKIKVWHGTECSKTLSGHKGQIRSMSSSDTGKTVVSVDDQGQILVWDVAQQPSRMEAWNLLKLQLEYPNKKEFYRVFEEFPYIVLEPNSSDRDPPIAKNLLHFLVKRGEELHVRYILDKYPEGVLALDVSYKTVRDDDQNLVKKKTVQSLLRRAMVRPSSAILECILGKMGELVTQKKLRCPKIFFESLQVRDICEALIAFPELCLEALAPILELRPISELRPLAVNQTETDLRRIMHVRDTWTGGADEIMPRNYWDDRYGPVVSPWESLPLPLSRTVGAWVAAAVDAFRGFWGRPRSASRVYAAPLAAQLGFNETGTLSPTAGGDMTPRVPGMAKSEQGKEHELKGHYVRPFFVAFADAAGPPFKTRHGTSSFLQTCVDVSQNVGNALIFKHSAVVAILDFKWKAYARFYYMREAVLYLVLLTLLCRSFLAVPVLGPRTPPEIITCDAFIWLFSVFFWTREYSQLRQQGFAHYRIDWWNYLDLITFSFIPITLCFRAAGYPRPSFISASLTLLFVWLKLLFYLR